MNSSSQKLATLCQLHAPVWMGILNATPDSFSDGGLFQSEAQALDRASQLVLAGAHILDVGGVSTRPGSDSVSAKEELERVFPIATAVRKRFPGVALSIDTFRPSVARALAKAGAIDLVNDVYAGLYQEQLPDSTLHVAREFDLGIALMHMQGTPQTMQQNPTYSHCISEVARFLHERATAARKMGIGFIAVDPGIGFGKRVQDNLALLSKPGIEACAGLGFPLLIGLSRKRFLGEIYKDDGIDMAIPKNRDARSKELEWRAAEMGAVILRSHVMPLEVSHE